MEVSLPLSLEIQVVATDISVYYSEGAAEALGMAGGRTKDASCSELRDFHTRGTFWNYMLGVPGLLGSKLVTTNFCTPLFTFPIRKMNTGKTP